MAELFGNFEVNQAPRWPVILRVLGGSFAFHVLAIVCLLYVPGIRDAFNIAALIADTSFVDKPYDRTEIGDDVQFVELSGEKFRYPDGYWAMENQPVAQMIPPTPAETPFFVQAQPTTPAQPEFSPSPTASPVVTPSASPGATASPAQTVAQVNASPSPVDQKQKAEEAQKQLEKTAAENNLTLPKENEINKKALKDFANYANDLKNQGKLDLDKPFEIVIEAELDQNGKLQNARFTKKAGDPNLVDLFGRMVSALNDSGFLIYLKPLDKDNPGSKVVFTIKQGESEVLATVESEASSDDSARILAKGFNAALAIGAESRAGKDEEVLLRNTSALPVGKKIIFNFTMPRQAVVDLIKKQLAT
jgi:hypothetical protein